MAQLGCQKAKGSPSTHYINIFLVFQMSFWTEKNLYILQIAIESEAVNLIRNKQKNKKDPSLDITVVHKNKTKQNKLIQPEGNLKR